MSSEELLERVENLEKGTLLAVISKMSHQKSNLPSNIILGRFLKVSNHLLSGPSLVYDGTHLSLPPFNVFEFGGDRLCHVKTNTGGTSFHYIHELRIGKDEISKLFRETTGYEGYANYVERLDKPYEFNTRNIVAIRL